MSKALAVLLMVGLAATVALAVDPLVLSPVKDTCIDNYNFGPHNSRSKCTELRFDKFNEYTLMDFDRAAIQSYITANLGGQSLSDAISSGRISVSLSVVPANVLAGNEFKQVMVGAVYSNDNWVEAPDMTAGGAGSDDNWNWTGAGKPADLLNDIPEVIGTVRAVTALSPFDIYHNPMDYDPSGAGGGEWHSLASPANGGYTQQQFKNVVISAVPQNLDFGMTGWVANQRFSTVLDPSIWADYVYNTQADGVTANGHGWVDDGTGVMVSNGVPVTWATNGLRLSGYDYDGNDTIYSKEGGGTVTPPVPHAGDCQNDGHCDVVDFGILAKNYDLQSGATWAMADFNADGKVDVVDLGILAKNYDWAGAPAVGTSTTMGPQLTITILPAGGVAVPEPVTLSLLAAGAVALIRRRR